MNINSIQIESFLVTVKHMNFSKAAAELYVTQPVLSRRILKFEEELCMTLFDRTQKAPRLTDEGLELYNLLNKMSSEFAEFMERAERNRNVANRKLRIGIGEGIDLSAYLHRIIDELKKNSEGMDAEPEFDSVPAETLINRFKDGYYDLIFIFTDTVEFYKASKAISGIDIREFIKVNKCVMFADNNPLSKKKDLTVADFKDQTLYCLKKEYVPSKVLAHKDLLSKYGIIPKVQFLSSWDAVAMALLRGEGYAITDNHERILKNKDIRYFDLKEKQSISIVTKSKPSFAVLQFLSVCKI